jgi:hypothetical protein
MAFNITDFTSNLNDLGETARADKFDVVISLPRILDNGGMTARLALQCENAEFPGLDITPIEYRHHAFIRRIPYHLNYTPLNLTFYCTGAMLEKQLFDAWMNLCVAKSTGLINYRQDSSGIPLYEATITVNQYDQVGNRTYFAQGIECFPISMSQLATNWSDDSSHRLSMTFAYTKWLTAADGATGASTRVQQSSVPFVTNFTNEIRSIIAGINGLDSKNPVQQLQSAKTLIGGATNLGTTLGTTLGF